MFLKCFEIQNKTDDADELESDEESLDEKWESHSTKATPELPTLTHKHSKSYSSNLASHASKDRRVHEVASERVNQYEMPQVFCYTLLACI